MRKKETIISNQKRVAKKMKTLVQQWTEVADWRATFLHSYMLVTNNMLNAIRAEEFRDRIGSIFYCTDSLITTSRLWTPMS